MFTQLFRTVDHSALPAGPRRGLPSPLAVARSAASPLFDALTGPHGVDRYIELVRPSFSLSELRAEVVHVRRQTTDSVTLRLRPNRLWDGFQAGQSVSLTTEIDGVRRSRCYSPANSQHATDGQLELTLRAHPHGLVSRHLFETARPGLVVGLAPAAGDFVLPAERPERVLLVSGGSGITPVLSILRTLCDEHEGRPVTFLHYARDERSHTYRAELAALVQRHPTVRALHVYTAGRRRAHFTRAQLTRLAPDMLGAPAYVCGPPPLVDAVRTVWANAGAADRVFHESFQPVRVAPVPGDAAGTVSFRASGTSASGTAAPLLEQAEAAGLRPAHACRMGICATCTCRKLSGRVRNVHTGELSSDEPGDIRICVSVPAGDVELDL
jgi:ferredoxin-NADP reductase